MCTKNHNHMRYGSWDTEWDGIFCHFEPFFALLPPVNQENQNFEKMKKTSVIILPMCTKNENHMMYGPWDMKHDRIFLSFWAIICTFYPTNNPKNRNFEKMKKTLGDIIILHKYSKNPDHTLCCSWDMVHDRCCCYFSFRAIFCPFTPPITQQIKIFKKMKKTSADIILHMCTKNYDQMMKVSWDMVHNRQMDWWMDRKSDT